MDEALELYPQPKAFFMQNKVCQEAIDAAFRALAEIVSTDKTP